MKKAFASVILLGLAVIVCADDGSWSDSRGYTPAEGALYSVTGNPDIALEKEYLQLVDHRSGMTRAVFLFRNTASAAVTVECAFPIRIQWYVSDYSLDAGRLMKADGTGELKGWDFGGTGKYASEARGPYSLTINDWLKALGVDWETFTPEDPSEGGQFISTSAYPTGRREIPAERLMGMLSLSIMQDGKTVPVSTCVADYGQAPGNYRAVIASVYPGTKWKDTCLGELTFRPGDARDLPAIREDPFFSSLVPK